MENGAGFKHREVVLGSSLGDSYVVEKGLSAGEEIVVNGTFTVDAAVQLAGKPSMMNPEENSAGDIEEIELSVAGKSEIQEVFNSYLALKNALVEDDFEAAKKHLKTVENKIEAVDVSAIQASAADAVENYKTRLQAKLSVMTASEDISALRTGFIDFSAEIIRMAKSLKPFSGQIYIQHCPMANNDRGADWLSLSEEIRNPYYGSAMLSCGEVTGVIED